MISEWSAELTLTEESSKALFDVLHQQDLEFINGLLDGKHGFTLQSSDGRSVELVPAPKWIPVSDRLPESDYMCLVSCKTKKGVKSVNRAYYSDGLWHGSGSMSGVEAWMPLPEPYTADTPQTDRMTEEEIDTMLAKALVGQTDCSWMRYEE